MAWVGDGSEQVSVQGDVVQCKIMTSGDNSYNALWKDGEGLKSGEAYWKIQLPTLEGGAFVGVTTTDRFAAGYKIRCLCYGGNLSDGGAGLVLNFGPRISANDTVGILVSFQGDRLKIYFEYNDTPLGLAFDVPADCMSAGVHPCVKFSQSGSASCKKAALPASRARAVATYTGVEGPWKLRSLTSSSDVGGVTLKLKAAGPDTYDANLKVINSVSFRVSKSGDQWRASGGASTLMGGSPEMMELERKMSQLVGNPTAVQFVDSQLHYDSGDVMSVWERYDDSPQPYVGNPFARG